MEAELLARYSMTTGVASQCFRVRIFALFPWISFPLVIRYTPGRPHHRLCSSTSPTPVPPSFSQLDYASLFAPSCFAPGLRMRSPYRRTCTVCVHIPIGIPLRLPKHRLRKQDHVVERSSATISYLRFLSRRGREDLGADAHARSAPRRAPALLVVPGLPRARIQLRVLARKHVRASVGGGGAVRRAGYGDLLFLRTSCNALDLGCDMRRGRQASTRTVGCALRRCLPRPAPLILKAGVGEMEKKEEERMGAVR
ncbi:hypothetical protein MVEN_00877500 [Mycena venus]|uniref:Uncharacterized protein n=1 Tax=Mycena venus TaxID=2733690 RepID=A0A8H6YGT1_9AGAR|nr:hypothetical protein MVEN_00877500 [Mycena venus]